MTEVVKCIVDIGRLFQHNFLLFGTKLHIEAHSDGKYAAFVTCDVNLFEADSCDPALEPALVSTCRVHPALSIHCCNPSSLGVGLCKVAVNICESERPWFFP